MTDSFAEKLRGFDPDLPLDRADHPAAWYSDPAIYAAGAAAPSSATPGKRSAGRSGGGARQRSSPRTWPASRSWWCATATAFCGRSTTSAAIGPPVSSASRAGKATRLRCRYHGWTYDLAGRLRGTPEFDGVADFCREDNGLPPLAVAVWGPLVWVHRGKPAAAARGIPRAVAGRAAGLGIGDAALRRPHGVSRWPATGRSIVDNYLRRRLSRQHRPPGPGRRARLHPLSHGDRGSTSVQISPLKPPGAGDDGSVGKVRTRRHRVLLVGVSRT